MAEFYNISPKVQAAIARIAERGGDPDKIDTTKERAILAEYLADNESELSEDDRTYIKKLLGSASSVWQVPANESETPVYNPDKLTPSGKLDTAIGQKFKKIGRAVKDMFKSDKDKSIVHK